MSAPSFSSFPPSFESFPDFEQHREEEVSKTSNKEEVPSKDRAESNKRHADLEFETERKRRKKKHKHESSDEKKKHEKLFFEAGIPGLYIIDTAGDRMNEVYGRLHAGDIPRYRRTGFGQVLGLPPHLKIIPRSSGNGVIQVGMNGKRPGVRYIESSRFSSGMATRLLLPSSSKNEPDLSSEFIPLPSARISSAADPLTSYRSIETTNLDSENEGSQSDEEILTDTDEDKTSPRTAHQQLLASLEATLREDPSLVSTWLALLKHSLTDTPLSSKAALNRARAEIKLSILERAMRAHPENRESIELRIKWLDAGSEIWDLEKLDKEWETAVRELGNQKTSAALRNAVWNEWLRWRISSVGRRAHGRANVDQVLDDAKRVIENVHGDRAKVKTFWRIAVALKEAGFPERAMALFQAEIEFVFNCPQKLISQDFSTRIGSLEDFWDSELPRVGESDAKGWHSWDGKSAAQAPTTQSRSKPQSLIETSPALDGFSRWAINELHLDATSTMPKRAIADDDDNPYSTILFTDLQPLIIDISTMEGKHFLRMAWLDFIGLHLPGLALHAEENSVLCDDTWAYSHLSRKPYLDQYFPIVHSQERQWDAIAGSIVAREKKYGSVFSFVKEWLWGALDPMEIINDKLILWEKWDMNIVDVDLAHRIFEQLGRRMGDREYDEEWEVLYLTFEAVNNGIKSALKLSRTLLSTSRESLRLWAAHIQLQRLRGKEDEARRVFETVLSSSSSHSSGAPRLWWAWAEMEWLANQEEATQLVILRSVGILSGGPTNILRAKRILDDKAVSSEDWRDREAWVCLRALLDMVFSSHTHGLEEAVQRLRKYIQNNSLKGLPRETAWTKMMLFAYKHATILKRQVRRNELRGFIEDAVTDMEREGRMNSIVLGVFLQTERGESVWGRVRALTGESGLIGQRQKDRSVDSVAKSLGRRMWEIWLISWERTDWQEEKERLRKSLMTAVSDQRTRASPTLWRIYVEFEIRCKELEKAKKVLFMAISECPLVKELYLLAFTALRPVFKPNELETWAETMAERGIRLHHGLEEYIVAATGSESDSRSDDGQGEDTTLEKEAEDFRRLAPF